jgi:hypothetical protein
MTPHYGRAITVLELGPILTSPRPQTDLGLGDPRCRSTSRDIFIECRTRVTASRDIALHAPILAQGANRALREQGSSETPALSSPTIAHTDPLKGGQ